MAVAMFGAGCFWGVEESFRRMPGVTDTQVGYAGGTLTDPTYEDVCSDRTGHAEVVRVEYDPDEVRYEDLMAAFWNLHDPTTPNRQGPDVGSQYRSVIFTHSPEQEETARASKAELASSGSYRKPIVTEILPAPAFYRAEEYHQKYLARRNMASCHVPAGGG